MDRAKFFAALRASFGGISQEQVTGTEALLDACIDRGVTALPHVAHVLSEVRHETGGYMLPIKETVFTSHKDKNPSDATVKARLERAWKAGRMPTVKTPYWRDGWFGRGQVQITHRDNYQKMGRRLGVDLVKDPSRTIELPISAAIAVVGMQEGLFRTAKLSDFDAPTGYRHKDARAIVNADVKKNGGKIAMDALIYEGALKAGGYNAAPAPQPRPVDSIEPEPAPLPPEPPERVPEPSVAESEPIDARPGRLMGGLAALVVVGAIAFWEWLTSLPCNLIGVFCS